MISRRAMLGAAGAVVVAGGAGAGVAALVPERRSVPRPPAVPQPLQQALDRELLLISALDAALRQQPNEPMLRVLRDDHAAHVAALRSAIPAMPAPSPSPSSSATSPPPTVPTVAQLRAAEHNAAQAAAAESAALTAADAALLASISACEATHAELLA